MEHKPKPSNWVYFYLKKGASWRANKGLNGFIWPNAYQIMICHIKYTFLHVYLENRQSSCIYFIHLLHAFTSCIYFMDLEPNTTIYPKLVGWFFNLVRDGSVKHPFWSIGTHLKLVRRRIGRWSCCRGIHIPTIKYLVSANKGGKGFCLIRNRAAKLGLV